jgi:hypothetical protein
MKKSILIALVVAISTFCAVTASATEWNLYGNARVATFWTSQDYGGDTEDTWGRSSVDELQWAMQGNSRIGATVKGDQVEGRFEFSVSSDGSGGNVGTRRLFGVWKFTEGWGLKVGKDYTPITFFLSGQVFDSDSGLKNVGQAYGYRRAQIAVEGMGFKAALIDPTTGNLKLTPVTGIDVDLTTEAKFPKLEVSYQFELTDAMSFHAFGGWQYFKQLQAVTNTVTDVTRQLDDNVTSYMFGAGADLNFGPFFVKPQVSWYKNGASAGWLNANIGLGDPINPLTGNPISQLPFVDANGGIVDQDSLMAMLALGFKPTESLRLEAGGGYLGTKDDNDAKNNYMEYYLQAVIYLAKGVYLVPEIGYRDYGDLELDNAPDVDLGSLWYAGAKWQIDF